MNPTPEIQNKHWNVTETMTGDATSVPYRELTLTWHFDSGHAWLQVHRETLEDFNLESGDFSEFSYADSHYLYLEEDCDATGFMKAAGVTSDHFADVHVERDITLKLEPMSGAGFISPFA